MNWIFQDNINTDLITPGRFNITTDPKELAKIAFIENRPEFAKEVKEGDFIVAEENFGCGSSRETAPVALKYCGIQAILAKSFARIFYRNCLNIGLLAIVADTEGIGQEDQLVLDVKKQLLVNKTQKRTQPVEIPPMMVILHEHNGIIEYLKQNGLNALEKLIHT